MWVIQRSVPYEGMYEKHDMSTEEVLEYLGSGVDFDEIYIRPVTRVYEPWDFIKEFRK